MFQLLQRLLVQSGFLKVIFGLCDNLVDYLSVDPAL